MYILHIGTRGREHRQTECEIVCSKLAYYVSEDSFFCKAKVNVMPLSHRSKIYVHYAAGRAAILSIQKRHIIFCRCHCQCSERSRRAAAEARQAVNRDCCSNTARFCHLSLFYRWASLDPIDLSVKQSLIRGQYHHYHHHQSKSCLPWPSTITPRVASCSFLLVHLLLLLLVGR